ALAGRGWSPHTPLSELVFSCCTISRPRTRKASSSRINLVTGHGWSQQSALLSVSQRLRPVVLERFCYSLGQLNSKVGNNPRTLFGRFVGRACPNLAMN